MTEKVREEEYKTLSQCPSCSTQTHSDFGMVSCDSCKSVFFINPDGSSYIPAEDNLIPLNQNLENLTPPAENLSDMELSVPENNIALEPPGNNELQNPFSQSEANYDNQNLNAFSNPEFNFEPPNQESNGSLAINLNQQTNNNINSLPMAELSLVSDPNSIEITKNFEIPKPILINNVAPPMLKPQKKKLDLVADIEEFANSNTSSGAQGMLSYNIQLSSLNSPKTLELLFEYLEDKKFKLDMGKLTAQAESGVIELKQLNATAASILLSKIKGLNIQIQWVQNFEIN